MLSGDHPSADPVVSVPPRLAVVAWLLGGDGVCFYLLVAPARARAVSLRSTASLLTAVCCRARLRGRVAEDEPTHPPPSSSSPWAWASAPAGGRWLKLCSRSREYRNGQLWVGSGAAHTRRGGLREATKSSTRVDWRRRAGARRVRAVGDSSSDCCDPRQPRLKRLGTRRDTACTWSGRGRRLRDDGRAVDVVRVGVGGPN